MRTRVFIAILSVALATDVIAQTSTPPASAPTGHWIADHPADKQTLALWWNFRPDGTLTLNAGGIADGKYQLTGTTLTLPPSEPGAAPGVFDIHFTNGKLYTTSHTDHPSTLEFTRIGEQTGSEPTLTGSWRLTSAPHVIEPGQEAIRDHMMNMITVYEADGGYHARMPVQTFTGTWSASTQTYKLNDYPPLHYERRGNDLLLAVPPDGKDRHLYHPDPVNVP